ncbi:hypothetical protein [Nocardioides astragali]|uniref:Uncharacterized protein n=1 Tax=Nocardioides astragali TaxID=1776736 RepID=A0ABW2MXR5_9ACTN|nr:hypothetical protein [Nocardioides astragali]
MKEQPGLRDQIVAKYREQDPRLDPDLLGRIVDDVAASLGKPGASSLPRAAFDVSWMDSYLAHWVLGQEVVPEVDRMEDLGPALRELMDARFAERLQELRRWVERRAAPPDGGTPEPGVPPVGPDPGPVPPDGGPPEPGVPPVGPAVFEPPDGGPPEPGVPPVGPSVFEAPDGGPPEPGTPPVGPQASLPGENPWILYWFVSLKAPLLLDVIDAHLERRLEEIGYRR